MTENNDDSLYREDGINKNTYKVLFEDNNNLDKSERQSDEMFILWNTIQEYTKWHQKLVFHRLLSRLFKDRFIDLDDIEYDKEIDEYKYVYNGQEYTFDILSKYIKGYNGSNLIKQVVNDIKVKKELHSEDRYGKCHSNSILLAQDLEGSKILTGYMTVGKRKVLHSVVIKNNKKGKPIVFDWTENLIISLDSYKQMVDFVEIDEVDSKDILADLSRLQGTNIDVKAYLTFRNELINDTKKNEEIFGNRNKI